MKSLAQYQRELLHAIVKGDREPGVRIDALLKPESAARFHVYVDGYKARYEESLLDAFPATARILGHDVFHRISASYARVSRSMHWDLSQVGCNWSEFLATQEEARQFPFLRDLARYEWILHQVFFMMDPGSPAPFPVEPEALAVWRPTFAPTVGVFRSEWPIHTLRESEEPPLADGKLAVPQRSEFVLVGRSPAGDVLTLLLTEPQASFQEKLFAGSTLADALAAVEDLTEGDVSALTRFWAQAEIIR